MGFLKVLFQHAMFRIDDPVFDDTLRGRRQLREARSMEKTWSEHIRSQQTFCVEKGWKLQRQRMN